MSTVDQYPMAHHPAEPAPPDPLIGAVIAEKYELIRLLGQGGMGAVYEGRNASTLKLQVEEGKLRQGGRKPWTEKCSQWELWDDECGKPGDGPL